jgi:hypothetical protein
LKKPGLEAGLFLLLSADQRYKCAAFLIQGFRLDAFGVLVFSIGERNNQFGIPLRPFGAAPSAFGLGRRRRSCL